MRLPGLINHVLRRRIVHCERDLRKNQKSEDPMPGAPAPVRASVPVEDAMVREKQPCSLRCKRASDRKKQRKKQPCSLRCSLAAFDAREQATGKPDQVPFKGHGIDNKRLPGLINHVLRRRIERDLSSGGASSAIFIERDQNSEDPTPGAPAPVRASVPLPKAPGGVDPHRRSAFSCVSGEAGDVISQQHPRITTHTALSHHADSMRSNTGAMVPLASADVSSLLSELTVEQLLALLAVLQRGPCTGEFARQQIDNTGMSQQVALALQHAQHQQAAHVHRQPEQQLHELLQHLSTKPAAPHSQANQLLTSTAISPEFLRRAHTLQSIQHAQAALHSAQAAALHAAHAAAAIGDSSWQHTYNPTLAAAVLLVPAPCCLTTLHWPTVPGRLGLGLNQNV